MKKILALILALAMVLAVVACTPAEPVQDQDPSAGATQAPATEPDAQEPAAEPTVLTVYTWWDVTKFEHLQMMEREQILISCQDERRRKYYYLSHDINIIVNLQKQEEVMLPPVKEDQKVRFARSLTMFKRMIRVRDELLDNLEHLERNIESGFVEMMRTGEGIIAGDGDLEILLALSHFDLTLVELEEMCSLSTDELKQRLNNLMYTEVVEQTNDRYQIRGTHGE